MTTLAQQRLKAAPSRRGVCVRSSQSVKAFLFQQPRPEPKRVDEAKGSSADEPFKRSVDVMLNRAASSLTRGPCTCLSCRGSGSLACPHCKGVGLLDPRTSERENGLRSALLRLRSAMGLAREVPYASSSLRTNRCQRCHGSGHLPCDHCSASGLRFPYLTKDDPRQCAGQPAGGECHID